MDPVLLCERLRQTPDVAWDSSRLFEELEAVREQFSAVELLDRFLGATVMDDVARRSYRHANGFDKIVLGESGEFALRLHIWWNGCRDLVSDIHNHNFDFASWILTGKMENILLTEKPVGTPAARYCYSIDSKMKYSMSFEQNVRLGELFRTEHPRDSLYAIDSSVVHSGNPNVDVLTATLVLQRSHKAMRNFVYRQADAEETTREVVKVDAFSRTDVVERLQRLRGEISVQN